MKPNRTHAWTKDEVIAIKACAATTEGRVALGIIVQRLCGLTTISFDRDALIMAFLEGRRSIGHEINAAVTTPQEQLVKDPHEPRSNRPISATERAAAVASGERTGRR